MGAEDIICHAISSNSIDLGGATCVNPDDDNFVTEPEKDGNNIDDCIFTMEDLGHPKGEGACGSSKVSNHEIESSTHTQVQCVQVVSSMSADQVSKVDIIKCLNNGDANALDDSNDDKNREVGRDDKCGVKRSQDDCNNKESSIRVVYSSLPSRSKRKLEELIHQWSEWHAQHCASAEDSADSVESGEESYFPALHVGLDKTSTVSFSMDVHVSKRQRKEALPSNYESSALYERGYAIGLASDSGVTEESGIDLREAPRCFNCGSFNHPLSGCPKPLDKTAVNSARKEFQSKKNLNTGPRVPTRYYQNSPGGKFDGLRPGALSKETRKLLGLGELDPPPWLNRMRELGYPPGYLHSEEHQSSGIAIYGDDDSQNGDMKNDHQVCAKKSEVKMTIDFPGINAPIPEKANQNSWAWAKSSGPVVCDPFQNRSDNRLSCPPETLTNRNFHGAYGPRNHVDGLSPPFGLGSSPPVPHNPYDYHPSKPFSPQVPHRPYDYHPSEPFSPLVPHRPYDYRPSEPFSPRGIPIPGSPHYGRPSLHYNYGTL